MKFIKKLILGLFSHYLMWFGVYNAIASFMLLGCISDTSLMIALAIFQVYETYFIWYKKIFSNKDDYVYLFGNLSQNNLLAIYGGIGTGKSTLANYILNKYVPDESLRYYNYKKNGYKCLDHDYLFLKKALPDGAGVFIDEAGRTYDSFKGSYEKNKDKERERILVYNKFFRQWYTDRAMCIYVDQCESNLNTSLRSTVHYVIQCRGVQKVAMPLLLGWFYAALNSCFNFTSYNIFGITDIDFLDFNKLGDYAEHYSVNYDAKDVKHFMRPSFELFNNHDTYVFKKYNPCVYDPAQDYVWGTSEEQDDAKMMANFRFDNFQTELKTT